MLFLAKIKDLLETTISVTLDQVLMSSIQFSLKEKKVKKILFGAKMKDLKTKYKTNQDQASMNEFLSSMKCLGTLELKWVRIINLNLLTNIILGSDPCKIPLSNRYYHVHFFNPQNAMLQSYFSFILFS